MCHCSWTSSFNFVQCVKRKIHAQNYVSSTHYHVLNKHFLLTHTCLKSNIDHVMGWRVFLIFWRRRVMFPLLYPRQQQRLLEGFNCYHLVQLPQGISFCTYRTTMFHWPEPQAFNIETHRYMVWNSKKDNGISRNPLLFDLLVVTLTMFPSPWPYQEEIVA